ncbi:hypothetical protein [Peribacillus glennii]|uniref:Uncharacterized protein n=1 Tax=Peribacillus glennii TaxID=2303991 RepID=A0A372LH13_9BACI|nr:hypothetical protein [Peribacillus glennii]RFU65369.1 hypothetical protein D0466_05605 [Peribacillus glennii]
MATKILGALLLLPAVFLLSSCDLIQTEKDYLKREQEIALLDENLNLKEKISDLEYQIAGLEKTQKTVSIIDEDVTQFFLAMENGNIPEVKKRVTDDVEFQQTGIHFVNGPSMQYGSGIASKEIGYIKLIDHELDSGKGKLTYEFYSSDEVKKPTIVDVDIIQKPEGWKISNFAIDS